MNRLGSPPAVKPASSEPFRKGEAVVGPSALRKLGRFGRRGYVCNGSIARNPAGFADAAQVRRTSKTGPEDSAPSSPRIRRFERVCARDSTAGKKTSPTERGGEVSKI